jgi:RHS repeat-associated protein
MLASLNIVDTPIRCNTPHGPAIDFTVTYNQRESQQPSTFAYSNLGPKWTFNWLSYVSDNPNQQLPAVGVYMSGGGAEIYPYNSTTQTYGIYPRSHAALVRTANGYERDMSDGSKQIFDLSDNSGSYPRRFFMTKSYDPTGDFVTITYDASFRVQSVKDQLNQGITMSYELPSDSLKITKVTETLPLHRSATFSYTNGQLTTISDEIGIQSVLHYASGSNFIDSLQTPYGTSTFATEQSGTNHWIEMTDPLGGKERVEYQPSTSAISGSEATVPSATGLTITNSSLNTVNTFFWDKKYTDLYPSATNPYDYTKARVTHWAKNADETTSGIAASEKAPLESRMWYNYDTQSDSNHVGSSASPTMVARRLDDGTTQLKQYNYNSIGRVTKETDPRGRVTSNVYASNNIDLLTVFQKNPAGVSTDPSGSAADKVASYTYNALHEPLTAADASNQVTSYVYNGIGQVQTVTNAKQETTTYGYGDGSGNHPLRYLTSITSPPFNNSSAVTTFDYDQENRVHVVTNNPDGYAVTTTYDNLDRPTQVSYLDGTSQQFQYTQDFQDGRGVQTLLDVTSGTDRRGYLTTRHYDKNRHLDSVTEQVQTSPAVNRVTQYGYCICGSLTSITDGNFHTTTFNRDLQSRVISKVFADNTSVSYVYENTTSRLKRVMDALGYSTGYTYFNDDTIQQTTNDNAPTVTFAYDSNYNRVSSMVDGIGTTSYTYYPVANPPALGANKLQTVDGPLPNHVMATTYSYDQLGRQISQSINGAVSSVGFDSLGRVNASDNPLGHFGRAYVSVTPRLQTLTYPVSTAQTANYSYLDALHDVRLQTLQNRRDGAANVSKFDYSYDSEGQIQGWTKQIDTQSAVVATFGYDRINELTGATNTTMGNFSYGYDLGGNITSDPAGSHTFNNVNQTQDTGYTYDSNGNLTSDGLYNYSWDGFNRLIVIEQIIPGTGGSSSGFAAISPSPSATPQAKKLKRRRVLASGRTSSSGTLSPGGGGFPPPTVTYTRSVFSYDGVSRRARIIEQEDTRQSGDTSPPNWVQVTDYRYIWSGSVIAEERDTTGAVVTRRFFAEGEQIGGANYYFTRDHLGSIRELTNSSGQMVERYEYDPYGNQPIDIVGTHGGGLADFGFTGHWFHGPSGLSLSLYRAYDPNVGRWISRDPIGERGGLNLYEYVFNRPLELTDRAGLAPQNCMGYALGIPASLSFNAPALAGCRRVTCGTTCDQCKREYKLVVIEDSDNSDFGHVYRQDAGGTYSCRYGSNGALGYGLNPVTDYYNVYYNPFGLTGYLKLTCWCCPGRN